MEHAQQMAFVAQLYSFWDFSGPVGIIALLLQIFWIWMLVDVITNPRLKTDGKILWVLVLVLTNLIGALIYFLIERPKR